MDITHTCMHCLNGKKVFRISLDLYDADGLLKRGVMRMKKFEFMCTLLTLVLIYNKFVKGYHLIFRRKSLISHKITLNYFFIFNHKHNPKPPSLNT